MYLHCLALLKDCMQRTTATHHQVTTENNPHPHSHSHPQSHMGGEGNNNVNNVHVLTLRRVQQGLTALFDQIILRVEQCHKRLSTLPNHQAHASSASTIGNHNHNHNHSMGGRSRR